MFRPTSLLLTMCLFCAFSSIGALAQQPSETLEDISDAPMPKTTLSMSSDIQPASRKVKPESKLEKRSFRLLEGLLVYSALEDLGTTNDFLHHPQYVEYRAVCGGQPCQSMSYGHNPLWFSEVGIPAQALRCGPRSVGCSLFATAANDVAVVGAAEILHHRGKLGKALALGLLVTQVVSNLDAWHNNKHDVLDERRYVPSGATGIQWYNPR